MFNYHKRHSQIGLSSSAKSTISRYWAKTFVTHCCHVFAGHDARTRHNNLEEQRTVESLWQGLISKDSLKSPSKNNSVWRVDRVLNSKDT